MIRRMNGSNVKQFRIDHIELIGSHHKIEAAKKFGVHAFFEDKHDNAVDIHEELDILLFYSILRTTESQSQTASFVSMTGKKRTIGLSDLFPIEEADVK